MSSGELLHIEPLDLKFPCNVVSYRPNSFAIDFILLACFFRDF